MSKAFLNEPSPKGGKFILPYILASELSLPTSSADNQEGVFISDFGLLVGYLTGHGVETALNLSKTHNFLGGNGFKPRCFNHYAGV